MTTENETGRPVSSLYTHLLLDYLTNQLRPRRSNQHLTHTHTLKTSVT